MPHLRETSRWANIASIHGLSMTTPLGVLTFLSTSIMQMFLSFSGTDDSHLSLVNQLVLLDSRLHAKVERADSLVE
jgi:hypothetical protein